MNKFLTAFSHELKKIFSGKSMFVFAVITIVLLVLMTIVFEFIQMPGVVTDQETEFDTPQEGIAYYDAVLAELDRKEQSGEYKPTMNNDVRKNYRRLLTYYQYLQDNGMSVNDAQAYSILNIRGVTGMDYVMLIMQVVGGVAAIAAIFFANANLSTELHGGALKMQLLRPVPRQTLLGAKQLASVTGGACLYGVFSIVASVYAMIRFGKMMLPQITFFSDTVAVMIPSGVMFVVAFLAGLAPIIFYATLAYFSGLVFKSRGAMLILPLVLLVFGELLSYGLGYIYVGYVDPLYNLSFMNTVSATGNVYQGSNILISLGIITIYIVAMNVYSYLSFCKRDMH